MKFRQRLHRRAKSKPVASTSIADTTPRSPPSTRAFKDLRQSKSQNFIDERKSEKIEIAQRDQLEWNWNRRDLKELYLFFSLSLSLSLSLFEKILCICSFRVWTLNWISMIWKLKKKIYKLFQWVIWVWNYSSVFFFFFFFNFILILKFIY